MYVLKRRFSSIIRVLPTHYYLLLGYLYYEYLPTRLPPTGYWYSRIPTLWGPRPAGLGTYAPPTLQSPAPGASQPNSSASAPDVVDLLEEDCDDEAVSYTDILLFVLSMLGTYYGADLYSATACAFEHRSESVDAADLLTPTEVGDRLAMETSEGHYKQLREYTVFRPFHKCIWTSI